MKTFHIFLAEANKPTRWETAWVSKGGKVHDAGGDTHQYYAMVITGISSKRDAAHALFTRDYTAVREYVVRAMVKAVGSVGFMKAVTLAARNAKAKNCNIYVETFKQAPYGGGAERADFAFEVPPEEIGEFLQSFDGKRSRYNVKQH